MRTICKSAFLLLISACCVNATEDVRIDHLAGNEAHSTYDLQRIQNMSCREFGFVDYHNVDKYLKVLGSNFEHRQEGQNFLKNELSNISVFQQELETRLKTLADPKSLAEVGFGMAMLLEDKKVILTKLSLSHMLSKRETAQLNSLNDEINGSLEDARDHYRTLFKDVSFENIPSDLYYSALDYAHVLKFLLRPDRTLQGGSKRLLDKDKNATISYLKDMHDIVDFFVTNEPELAYVMQKQIESLLNCVQFKSIYHTNRGLKDVVRILKENIDKAIAGAADPQ